MRRQERPQQDQHQTPAHTGVQQLQEALERKRAQHAEPLSLLRLPVVLERTGLSKTGLYKLAREGKFPGPVPLGGRAGGRAVAWPSDEVHQWILSRIEAARKPQS